MRCTNFVVAVGGLLTVAGLAHGATTVFLNSDGNLMYRSYANGTVEPVYNLSSTIIGMTVLPAHAHVNGAGPGDVIAISGDPDVNGNRSMFRVDNAESGVPTLVQIGQTANTPLSSLSFAGGKLYGMGGQGGNLVFHELDAAFNVVFTYNAGISQTGHGGTSYDVVSGKFFATTSAGDKLEEYTLGGAAADVGASGVDFRNQGLEFYQGTLFGAIHRTSDSRLLVGSFAMGTGLFTQIVDVGASTDRDIGFVALPAPGSIALLGLAGLVAGRRRR